MSLLPDDSRDIALLAFNNKCMLDEVGKDVSVEAVSLGRVERTITEAAGGIECG